MNRDAIERPKEVSHERLGLTGISPSRPGKRRIMTTRPTIDENKLDELVGKFVGAAIPRN